MKMSGDFFKRPTASEIKNQYKSQPSPKKNSASKNKKKIMTFEENTEQNEANKRSNFGNRLLDFSKKNRFKFTRQKLAQENSSNPAKLPEIQLGSILQGKGRTPRDQIQKTEDTENRGLKSEQSEKSDNQKVLEKLGPDCVICCASKADIICMPCGHSGVCRECMLRICIKDPICFMCKKTVTKLLRIDPTRQVGEMVIVLSSIPVVNLNNI